MITSIDNQPVIEMNDLIAYLARRTKVDQKVTIMVLRDDKQEKLDVTLAARPSAEERASTNSSKRGITLGILGMTTSIEERLFQMDIGPSELIIILVIVLLIFGPGRIAKIGPELGSGIRQFRQGLGAPPEQDIDNKEG